MFLRRTIILLFTIVCLQSCVWDRGNEVKINISNLSKNRVYVNSLSGDCDSCEIQRDIKSFCSTGNSNPPSFDTINLNDSLSFDFKSGYIKVYTVNADSLDSYCKKGLTNDGYKKSWIKILTPDINSKNKTGFIIIR